MVWERCFPNLPPPSYASAEALLSMAGHSGTQQQWLCPWQLVPPAGGGSILAMEMCPLGTPLH